MFSAVMFAMKALEQPPITAASPTCPSTMASVLKTMLYPTQTHSTVTKATALK
jgi:hypothetical protein